MFEFHGWANVQCDTYEQDEAAETRLMTDLRQYIVTSGLVEHAIVNVATGLNGLQSLTVASLRSHYDSTVIDVFRWLAQNGPGSYGLLYLRDDEDQHEGGSPGNEFRVWRLARGALTEMADPFLSPCVPVIEKPFDRNMDINR